ncbi:MAG: PKD domain-containing protein [Bacteroidetes bacterium]|nr:PKD domain-containing protein [Bacteroidota bacterium]
MTKRFYTVLCIVLSFIVPLISNAQAPVANFSSNVTSGCSPIVANFTDLSTNTPTSWYWDLGNGSTSTLQNPSTTYFTPGTYTVTLTATNANGSNTKVSTNYITVAPSPIVAFTTDSTPSCTVPRTLLFTNNSVPGGSGTTTYLWDFGDGTTSTSANPTKTYNAVGTYSVTLLVTNGNGCTNSLTKTNYVSIIQKPTASFSGTNITGCTAPLTATFTNSSSNATSYAWDFGDGGTSTASSPTHTYNATGSYNVRLIATNSIGCKDTLILTSYVTIGSPTASFYTSVTSTCTNQAVTFTNTSTPAGYTSSWNFGDFTSSTATSPSHSYTTGGTYTVLLTVTRNGCTDTESHTVTVNPAPSVNFTASPTNGCAIPFTTTFTNSTTGATSYLWSFGDATTSTNASGSFTKTYSAFGNYTVKLVATSANGCKDSLTRSSYIKVQTPTASITVGPYSGCAPVTVNFTANVTTQIPVSNYTWNFGDLSTPVSCSSCSTQSHTYSSSGTYTVTLTYTTGTGCTFTTTTSVQVSTKPTAGFTASPLSLCPGLPVSFSNSSSGASTYLWLFGDNTTSTATNPTHTGYAMGVYTVTLIANNNGCRDTFTRTNYITVNPPMANFGITKSCTNRMTVTLTDSSVGADTYSWNFGDGNTSTSSTFPITHTYASPGTYNISLQVYNSTYGCTHSVTKTVTVQPLVAQFSANDTTLCKGQAVTLTATPSSIITSYYFDWGINGVAASYPTNVAIDNYPYSGVSTVKLVVTDVNGCKDSLIKPNYIKIGGTNVSFTANPPGGCLPLTVLFTDNSSAGPFGIATRTWTFNGAPISTTSATISQTFTVAQSYNVKLVETDSNGCKDSLTRSNYIIGSKPIPNFTASPTNVCAGQDITFNNTTIGNSPVTYLWDFGDGGTSTAYYPLHAYSASGTYNVKLVATDGYGCKDSITKTSFVTISKPTAAFTPSDTVANCPPLAVSLTNNSVGATSYSWTFGNASASSLTNPSTVYTYPGNYNIKLVVTSSAGCKDSAVKVIHVNGPTGTFSYSPLAGCKPMTVNFSATTSGASYLVWDMSNGVTQTTTSGTFSYTYTSSGKYVPKLVLSDGASCLVPVLGLDTIKVDYIDADFSFTPSVVCNSGSVQFTDTVLSAMSPLSTRSWTFGDGGTSTAHNPSHSYTGAGTYNVRLIVTNTQGCSDTITKQVIINGLPTVSAASNTAICQGTTTGVSLTASGAASYSWSPATGLSCTTCANPVALPSSTTTYIVTGTDSYGCTDTGVVTITVNAKPNVTASPNTAICLGTSTTLTGYGATTYTWTPSGTLSCSACTNTNANPTTTTTYIVTGTDANGCTDTGMVTVTVNPKPVVSAGADQTICVGNSVSLNATGATSYSWSPATGLSCTTCANPTANPSTTTTYIVTGTNANGCTNTDTVIVNVNPLPIVSAGSNVAICSGSSTTLTATGATSYSWSPATGLSCTTCASPIATPSATTTCTVTGTNANGCVNTATVTVTVNAKPNVTASANTAICFGSSTTLTGYGASTYVWTPATGLSCTSCTSPVASPSTTTTYIVTGTDANGCTDTGMVLITVNPKPTVSAGADQTICSGSSVSLTATGATSYTWSPSTGLSCTTCANPTASPTVTTTYIVTGTNANGCINTDTITVNVNQRPNVSAGSGVSICIGSATTLTATGAATYVWSPSAGLSCTTCASPSASPASTTLYTVTGTDANGCTNTSTVNVIVNSIPVVTATGGKTMCDGDSAQLLANGATSYVWTPVTGLSCTTCTNPMAKPGTTTTYIVTGTTNGCSDTGMVIVTVRPKPTVSAGPDKEVCIGSSIGLLATGANSYVWSPATNLSCTNCASTTANPTTNITYTVLGTDANGCVNSAQVKVTVNPLPVIDAGPDQTICNGSSVKLTATGASTYTWTPFDGLSCTSCQDPVASPNHNITYSVRGTDNKGCSSKDEVNVTVIEKMPITFGPGDTICKGESATLYATGGTKYSWTPTIGIEDTRAPNIKVAPEQTTIYRAIVTQGDCFTDTSFITVLVHDLPEVSLGPDVTIGGGNSIQLDAKTNMAVTYAWTPLEYLSCTDCQKPIASPAKATIYSVIVTNEFGCQNKDDIVVNVTCDKTQIYVANTFTPNNDGVNDMFYPQGKGINSVKSFKVFNRWGELMFSRMDMPLNDPNAGWDGTFRGTVLKPDVYVYIINAFCESGEPLELKGDISLIR